MSATNPLAGVLRSYNQPAPAGVQPMSLEQTMPREAAPAAVGEGMQVDTAKILNIQQEALCRSYVYGYIMNNAPQTTMFMTNKKSKENGTVTIGAKESKPSRVLRVLMAIPQKCIYRSGRMGTPSDIRNGTVDFDNESNDLFKMAYDVNAATQYINALGGLIPEYAPTALGPTVSKNKQWSPEAILSHAPNVSYVRIRPSVRKNAGENDPDRFRFHLAVLNAPRQSLYSQYNICCMRAVEHVPVECNTEEQAYKLNEIAFGVWRYRYKAGDTRSSFGIACDECPSTIWEQNYTIDGQTVSGIGSAFFMAGQEQTNKAGEQIVAADITYFPWYMTGALKPDVGVPLKQLAYREFRPAGGTRQKDTMVTKSVQYANDPDNALFAPYRTFVENIIKEGFIGADALQSLGRRSSSTGKTKSFALTEAQKKALESFGESAEVEAAIQSIQLEAMNRKIIAQSRR